VGSHHQQLLQRAVGVVIRAVAATGQLGSGFKAETLARAAEGAHFIGCDAGSSDPGPYYLGSGETHASDTAVASDLQLILAEGLSRNIPVLIGSAGTAGGRPHLQRTVDIVRALAARNGWHFPLAMVDSEIEPALVLDAYENGRLSALAGAPPISAGSVRAATRTVAMQGPECFVDGLERGAQVVIAGRASDTAIYAAFPSMHGIPESVALHAAKILECGAAAAVERMYPDCMVAELDEDGFTVEPPNPLMVCTPQSVASHAFYETADPFRLAEPHGTLDTSQAIYTAASDRAVRVTGSRFEASAQHTVRLEAATHVGFRTVVIAGIRDPLVVDEIEPFVAKTRSVVQSKVLDSLGLAPESYRIRWNVYGHNGSMGSLEPNDGATGHEVALLIDIVAAEQEVAQAIGSVAWHTALHQPVPQYSGLVSHLAFPISPPAVNAGPVYEFSLNHVMQVDSPRDAYRLTMEQI
jgi:hypothetical protein